MGILYMKVTLVILYEESVAENLLPFCFLL